MTKRRQKQLEQQAKTLGGWFYCSAIGASREEMRELEQRGLVESSKRDSTPAYKWRGR